jgi:hypothetical protein
MINEKPRETLESELRLTVAGDDAELHLRMLREWLASEDELRCRVELWNQPIAPGYMGGVVDVLAVYVIGEPGRVSAISTSSLIGYLARSPDRERTWGRSIGARTTVG